MKTSTTLNYKMKNPVHLLQTTLMINTLDVYVFDNVEYYMSTCKQAIVIKSLFDGFGDDVYIYGLKNNPIVRRNIKLSK